MSNAQTNENKFAIPDEVSPFDIEVEVKMNETMYYIARRAGLTADAHPTLFAIRHYTSWDSNDNMVQIETRSHDTLRVTWDNIAIIEEIINKYIARDDRNAWESQRSEKTQLTKLVKSAKGMLNDKATSLTRKRDAAIKQVREAIQLLNIIKEYSIVWREDECHNAGLVRLDLVDCSKPETYPRSNVIASNDVRSYFHVVDGKPEAYFVFDVYYTMEGDDMELRKLKFNSIEALLEKASKFYALCVEQRNIQTQANAELAIEALNAASISIDNDNNNNY